jgi:DNA-binding transcriptional regulator YiaG
MKSEDLITWRKMMRIRRVWLARYLGVTPMTVYRWEHGIHPVPPYLNLALMTLMNTAIQWSEDEMETRKQAMALLED